MSADRRASSAADSEGRRAPIVVLAWVKFQARTVAIAEELGGVAYFVRRSPHLMRWYWLPLRYLVDAVETWVTLSRQSPRAVVAISPPVFAPLVAWLWCAQRRVPMAIDCHTSAFDHRWRWTRGLHRWLGRRVRALAVHTEAARAVAAEWSPLVFVLPDELPRVEAYGAAGATWRDRVDTPLVVVAGSLNDEEPIAATMEAAALLPECSFLFTGESQRLPAGYIAAAPPNVRFSGWLDYPAFIAALREADIVATFSTGPHMVNRAAFEAIAAGRALVLSDFPALRERFGAAAIFAANTPDAMAAGVRQALVQRRGLEDAGVAVRGELLAAREAAMRQLADSLMDRSAVSTFAAEGEMQP